MTAHRIPGPTGLHPTRGEADGRLHGEAGDRPRAEPHFASQRTVPDLGGLLVSQKDIHPVLIQRDPVTEGTQGASSRAGPVFLALRHSHASSGLLESPSWNLALDDEDPDDGPPKKRTPKPIDKKCPTDFKITARCTILKVDGGRTEISAADLPGFSGGIFEWTTSSPKLRLSNATSPTVTIEALAAPSSGRDAEVITVTRTSPGCSPVSKTVTVTVAKVTFSASPNQRYGYDDFDTPGNPLDDHICIRRSDFSFLQVRIEGGAVGTDFDFLCDDGGTCTTVPPPAQASFDLRLNAGAQDKSATLLHAKVKCPSAVSFTRINVHVYKQKVVEVVVAKIDATTAAPNLVYPTADYAAHATPANDKLKEAVVRYNISNFDPANGVTAVPFVSGTGVLTYDIAAGGGADLAAIGAAMTGTGSKIRVAIIRNMRSVYILSAAAAVNATTLIVTAGSTFFQIGDQIPVDVGANREVVTVTALSGGTITCSPLTKAHAVGATVEFNAAGWSSDPILIIEGSASLPVAKWTVLHEVGHRALTLKDIIDVTDFMHFSQAWTDYRLRYCPRVRNYPAGTTATENQWELIPRT